MLCEEQEYTKKVLQINKGYMYTNPNCSDNVYYKIALVRKYASKLNVPRSCSQNCSNKHQHKIAF